LAVKIADVAMPLELVVAVFTPPAKVPLAPVAGTSKVTSAPLSGFPLLSSTVTDSGAANAALTVALCGVPLVVAIDTTAPVMFLRLKLAAVATPASVAVTT
jgi:hypothetical protein